MGILKAIGRFLMWLFTELGRSEERQRQAEAGKRTEKTLEDIGREVDALDDNQVQEELNRWRRKP